MSLVGVSTIDLAAASTGDFTWLTGAHKCLKILGNNIVPPDGSNSQFRLSTDGSTFLAGTSYQYSGATYTSSTEVRIGSTGAAEVPLHNLSGAVGGEGFGFEMMLYSLELARHTSFFSSASGETSASAGRTQYNTGHLNSAAEVLGIRFLNSAGTNYTSGLIWIYEYTAPA
jgi:hypothetical protein